MPHNEDLKPEERKNLDEQLRIVSREAEIRENMTVMPGAPSGLTDLFLKNIMDFEDKLSAQPTTFVGDRLGEHKFLEADKLTEEAAESAVVDLLNVLAKNNIGIDHPEMVTAQEFYRWLCDDFVKQEVTMPVGDGWNMNYIYTELVPEGPDAMNFIVKTCVDGLFRLDYDFNPWIFENDLLVKIKGDLHSQLLPVRHRYLSAWRDAIRSVESYQYTPVAGVRIDAELADFTFEVAYALVREDGRREEFSGSGTARLVYDGCYWGIRSIGFPGFEMFKLSLS